MLLATHDNLDRPSTADGEWPRRCCDLAKIGLLLAIAVGFLGQGIAWLAS